MYNAAKTVVLLGALTGLILLVGDYVGGPQGMMIAFLITIVMNFGSYWFSDKIVLAMYGAQPVGPEHPLYRIVERLTVRSGLPMPRVYIIPTESPNAFATGRNPNHAAVAATEGILRLLSEHELEGVVAHELSHVRNRDILISSVAATLAGVIMLVARMAQFAMIFGGYGRDDEREGSNPLAMLLLALVAPLAALLIQMAISRAREYQADASGAELVGTPYGLADALRKLDYASKRLPLDASPATSHLFIMKPFTMSGLMALFSTHPPTEERIKRLLHQA